MPVTLDFSFDDLITPYAKTLLAKHYFASGETSPQEAYARAAEAYSGGDDALAQRIYEYAAKQWMMFASPVLSNAPKRGEPWKALPASCFLSWVGDTRESIVDARSEVAWLTFMGGGVGSHVSSIRAAGAKSNGPIPFLKVMDTQMLSDRQANIRRGSIAFYMDVSHVDVMEFIASKDPAGNTGEVDRKLLNSFPAINLTDKFMTALKNDSDWDFICPHTREVKGTIKAREVWRRIMDYRRRTGVPYLCFIDTANKKMPQEYKDKGLNINGSNLCCVHGSQRVFTLEHGAKTAKELAEIGGICTVRGSGSWIKTKTPMTLIEKDAEMVRIVTDTGQSHIVTLNHKIMTSSGKKKEARDLTPHTDKAVLWDENAEVFDYAPIIAVIPYGKHDSYCWEVEAEDHLWVCNGFLSSNSEIFIPTSDDRTAVCVLSSVNLEKWDEWKDHPTFVQDLVTLLDNVVEKFIENCPPQLHKAKLGALRGRDIGLGAMGLHALFQAKGIPFGSLAAKMLNKQIFKTIRERADEQNYKLSIERGAAPDAVDKRCVQLMAIAPNSNNSVILGTSASIEPWADNAFIRDTRVGQELVKNKHLEQLLETKGKNTQEVWKSIIGNEGSVTHLDFLTDDEREVFKTAFEIDQRWIIELAADRQEYIDQGQSLNLFFDSNASNKAMSDTHILAWEKGLKSLYYLRSKAASRPNITQAVERVALGSAKPGDEGCLSCQG